MLANEFLGMFPDSVFVNLDEKKEFSPQHTQNLDSVLNLNLKGRWGAYFSVNGFGSFATNTSRKKEFATSLNAHFVEIDDPGKSVAEIRNSATLLAAENGIPFTAIVETGRGIHGYWLLKEPVRKPTDGAKQEYERIQDALVELFKGDIAARDISRILRIPSSKYWKDGSGKEMRLGIVTDNRYKESDFEKFRTAQTVQPSRNFVPMKDVLIVGRGERHRKAYVLALKICNQFNDSHEIAHTIYRAAIDRHYEHGDNFHQPGGEADKQFDSAWDRVQSNPSQRSKFQEEAESKTFSPALSLADLMIREFPAAQWIIERLFESDTINMISAPPNHYKSWVVLDIALAVAKGVKLYDTFQTTKQTVMIVNEEDSARLLQDRLKKLGSETADLPIYFHVMEGIKLTDSYVSKLLIEAESKGVTLIVFDSLRSVHDMEENSSQEMQVVMDQLKKFSRKGISVLFTHHNRKKQPFGGNKNDGEETRGSSAINAAVHGHLSIYAHDERGETFLVVRQQKLKADEKIKPFELLLTKNPWTFTYRPHKDDEREETRVTDRVMDALGAEDVWLTVEELVSLDTGGTSAVRNALKDLVHQKYVQMKTRKDAETEKLPIRNQEGASNQKLYHIVPEEWPDDSPAD